MSSRYNKANCEIADEEQDPTTVLARFVFTFRMMMMTMMTMMMIIIFRYEFQIIGAVTSSLVQFCLQFGSYMVILYMLETLARLNEDSASEVQLDKGTRVTGKRLYNDRAGLPLLKILFFYDFMLHFL